MGQASAEPPSFPTAAQSSHTLSFNSKGGYKIPDTCPFPEGVIQEHWCRLWEPEKNKMREKLTPILGMINFCREVERIHSQVLIAQSHLRYIKVGDFAFTQRCPQWNKVVRNCAISTHKLLKSWAWQSLPFNNLELLHYCLAINLATISCKLQPDFRQFYFQLWNHRPVYVLATQECEDGAQACHYVVHYMCVLLCADMNALNKCTWRARLGLSALMAASEHHT